MYLVTQVASKAAFPNGPTVRLKLYSLAKLPAQLQQMHRPVKALPIKHETKTGI